MEHLKLFESRFTVKDFKDFKSLKFKLQMSIHEYLELRHNNIFWGDEDSIENFTLKDDELYVQYHKYSANSNQSLTINLDEFLEFYNDPDEFILTLPQREESEKYNL